MFAPKTLSKLLVFFAFSISIHGIAAMAQEDCTDTGSATLGTGSPNEQPGNGTGNGTGTVTPDWMIEAESAIAPKEFEHECFQMRSIVCTKVNYFKPINENAKSVYEKLWYHDGRPIGMEKQGSLKFAPDANVGIRIIEPACASGEETKASANIILRLVLDVLLNKDKVASVTVPSNSYQTILAELQHRGAQVMPPGEEAPETANVKFDLQSQSTGMRQAVYFLL